MILTDYSLKELNTFGIEAKAKYFTEIKSTTDFINLLHNRIYQDNKKLILGGGSNVLLTGDFEGLVIKNNLKGISLVREDNEYAFVKAMGGEVWHDFVLHTINNGWGGLENLSLIPGCVGASPMQNIGAYGVEIKDVFEELEAIDMQNGEMRILKSSDCRFGYRESVFKNELKGKHLIVSVTYKLNKKPQINTAYGAIAQELKAMNVNEANIKDVSNAVIRIRQSKLPDPKELGNAGSFFKNPEVDENTYANILRNFPDLVAYPLNNKKYKLAAGWLIEKAGWKGVKLGNAGVHAKQALVLVNLGGANGSEIYNLSSEVIKSVLQKFDVQLEREVNII